MVVSSMPLTLGSVLLNALSTDVLSFTRSGVSSIVGKILSLSTIFVSYR
jgi:hypothetical protein